MIIKISGLKVFKGEDSLYDSEIDAEISRGCNNSFNYNESYIELEIENCIYKFRSSDLLKAINAVE